MKKTNYSIKKLFKKGIATLLTASMVVTAVQAPAFADNVDEEVTESSASVTGLVHKKITLELVSDELKEAALTAIRENRLFDAQDYLAATGDNQKALREYEAFFNENPGLYVVDAPESVVDTLSGEDAELRIFVQKDAKMAKVDLTASPSEITREDSTESKNVEFRYGTDKDIILYEPASNVDTLVNGGEDAYYIEPEQEIGDNSDYELTGNEKITFMFVNSSDGTVRFTLKVDGVTYDKIEVGGREAALKKIVAEAGTKKSTEETTVAETTVAETTTAAVTAVTDETTVADETTAAEVQEVETEAPAEETTAEGTEIANADADNVSAETEETTAAVEETAAETEAPAAETDAEVKEEAPAEVTKESETEATIPEKIAEAISEAFGGAGDAVLGRMTVYADTIVGEGVQFEVEENTPAACDSEEAEDKDTNEVAAEAVEAAAGEDTATEADEVNEETTAAVEAAADDNTALAADTTALQIEVSEGLSEDEAENQVEETVAQEVTVVETEPETVAETEAPKETIAKDDETKAAKVATASEIAEYDDFALELIAEVKEEVLQDKAAAKENIKVARIAQYTINELGKIHYETKVDGFNVEVFAAKNAFGDITPTLEAKKLAKPEEAEASEDKLSDDQVAELKANNIYDNSQSLDIHFLDGFGKEVEPSETVKVRITLSDENLLKTIDASSLEVHHIKETDDTLKTEKVAATEDVKLLDANDEQIETSELKKKAEDDSTDVEVASAIAEFDVDSFSIYTITWKYYGLRTYSIKVHYVDQSGKNILENSNGLTLDLNEADVILSEKEGGVTNYTYVEARLGSSSGTVIDTVKRIENDQYAYVSYYNNGSQVDYANDYSFVQVDDGAYTYFGYLLYYYDQYYQDYYPIFNAPTDRRQLYYFYDDTRYNYYGQRYSYLFSDDVYFVYKKTEVPQGGNNQPIELDAPAANKELTDNGDGTYTLTLSVTGTAKSKTTHTGANVLLVVDTSGSMGYTTNDGYQEDTSIDATYGKRNGQYIPIFYNENDGKWYRSKEWNRKRQRYDYSNEYKGTRYKKVDQLTRIQVAKSAIGDLADALIGENGQNTDDNQNAIELGLISFSTHVNTTTTKTSNYTTFMNAVNSLNAWVGGNGIASSGGTNWEEALLAANSYDFNDDDPIYVIFVSDGNPTFRQNQLDWNDWNNQYQAYGNGQEGEDNEYNVERSMVAAVSASTALIGANKKLYAVNAFSGDGADGAESNMKALFGSSTVNYFNATDHTKLNEAFAKISNIVKNDVGYSHVTFVDGISNLTATMEVLGTTGDYTYQIVKKNDQGEEEVTLDADVPAEIKTASYNNGSVTWNVGGDSYKLEDGVTYKVSFVVWPKQEAYDLLADAANGKITVDQLPAGFVTDTNGNVVYRTNTGATVSYQTVNVVTQGTNTTTTYSEVKTSSIDVYPTMSVVDKKLKYEKKWKLDDPAQKKLFTHTEIQLNLQKKNSAGEYKNYFAEPFTLDGTNATESTDNKEITWSNDDEIVIAPGILMSETDGIKHGFNKTDENGNPIAQLVTLEGTDTNYYIVEQGHDYRFYEKVGNASFELEDIIYHPMVVGKTLKNVKFKYAEDGKTITAIESLGDVEHLTTLTAVNVVKLENLTVSKKYTGNMAELQATTFDLHLYADESGQTVASYDDGYIEELNAGDQQNPGVTLTKQSAGVYRFTVAKPESLDKDASVTIVLPSKAIYMVEEVNPGTNAGYTTYCGTSANPTTKGRSTDEISDSVKFKLSGGGSVNTIYFINKKEVKTPTGIGDNAIPFVALALTGLASMVFLAYDFQKRRLFVD